MLINTSDYRDLSSIHLFRRKFEASRRRFREKLRERLFRLGSNQDR